MAVSVVGHLGKLENEISEERGGQRLQQFRLPVTSYNELLTFESKYPRAKCDPCEEISRERVALYSLVARDNKLGVRATALEELLENVLLTDYRDSHEVMFMLFELSESGPWTKLSKTVRGILEGCDQEQLTNQGDGELE
jgi:hypothetical protein